MKSEMLVDLFLRRGPLAGGRADPPAPGGTPTPSVEPPAEPTPPATPPTEAAPPTPAVTPPSTPAAPPAPPAPSEWEQAFGAGVKPAQVLQYIQHLTRQAADAKPAAPAAPTAPPPNLREMIFEDPEKALDYYFNTRTAPALAAVVDQTAQVVGDVVGKQVGADGKPTMPHFDKYKGEIKEFVGRVAPALRGRAETWQSAYNYVVGQHLNEIVQEEIGRRAPAVEFGAGTPAAPAKGKVDLSAEEQAIASAMGMTPEEYAEWR